MGLPRSAAIVRLYPPITKASAKGKNVLKRISTVRADLQHSAVEAEIRVQIGGFEIKIVPER